MRSKETLNTEDLHREEFIYKEQMWMETSRRKLEEGDWHKGEMEGNQEILKNLKNITKNNKTNTKWKLNQ